MNPEPKASERKRPKVSIGMPVYNGAKYLTQALDSLLAQTMSDFELLISDNASTDETEQIARKYASLDPRVSYVRQPTNLGVGKNFLYVLQHTAGEYFLWAAHDDFWDSDWLEKLLRLVESRAHTIAFGSVVQTDEDGVPQRIWADFDYSPHKALRIFQLLCLKKSQGNLIYAMYPRSYFESARGKEALELFFGVPHELFALFRILEDCAVLQAPDTNMHKRVFQTRSRSTATRVTHYLLGPFQHYSYYFRSARDYDALAVLLGSTGFYFFQAYRIRLLETFRRRVLKL